jgi:hypothetical protein
MEAGRTATIHIITPAAPFTNRGKSDLALPQEFANELARALFLAGQTLHREKRHRERNPFGPRLSRNRNTPNLTEVLLAGPGARTAPTSSSRGSSSPVVKPMASPLYRSPPTLSLTRYGPWCRRLPGERLRAERTDNQQL